MSRRIVIVVIVLLLVLAGIIWLSTRKDEVTATPVLSIAAFNQTQSKNASDTQAHPQDVIVYTLNAENQSDKVISGYVMEANISEITDKASLVDASGASYNAGTNSLVWTPLDIPANDGISKQFSVRVNVQPTGSTNSVMKIKFNNELAITIAPTQSVSGSVTPTPTPPMNAPQTGPSGWMAVMLAMLTTAGIVAVKKYKLAKI